MLRNYIKIALRNLLRFKGYTFINILGLVMGISACLLIIRYVSNEWSYDQHHVDKENIYRVDTEFFLRNEYNKTGQTPGPLAKAITADFPEVLDATRIYIAPEIDKYLFDYKGQAFFEEEVAFADSNFFELLTYEFIVGDKTTALDQPFSIVLSDKAAKKIFGTSNPLDQTIKMSSSLGEHDYQITGVFDNQKYTSHLARDFYIAAHSGAIGKAYYQIQEWAGINIFYTYVRLQEGTNTEALTAAFPTWLDGYAGETLRSLGIGKRHYLTNIGDIYLRSEGGNWHGGKGNSNFLYLLMAIAAFILLIACINFINLSTAKAGLRRKEVGVRKVMGASRANLIKQFMSEAFIYVFFAVILAYFAATLALPTFNSLTDKTLSLSLFQDSLLLYWLAGFIVVTTLIAGSYPAFYLSSFNPVKIFRNKVGTPFSASQIRNALVVFQFIISIALIQGVLVIQEQMDFINSKNLGFNEKAKVLISLNTDEAYKNYKAFRQELLNNNQVLEVGASSSYPGGFNPSTFFYTKQGQNKDEGFMCLNHTTTPEFMELMEFELLKGRLFDVNRIADTAVTVVITEKAMKGIGFTLDNVLGQKITLQWADNPSFTVIGVIKDYHATSLHDEIQGQVFDWSPRWPSNYMVASVNTSNLSALLPQIEATWQQLNPKEPFEFQFLEDRLQENYLAEQRMRTMVTWGTLLAIFISCLGLLGLVTFAAERRQKEIGVRKILGASILDIITLLSKNFIKLVLLALLIAIPLSWYGMNQWLDAYAYRIDIQWWMFALSGIIAIGITLITVGFQSVKAALVNPVDSLHSE